MPEVTVVPLDAENWRDVLGIEVTAEQRALLDFSPMIDFLAESRFHLEFVPHAIRSGETVVGFVTCGSLERDPAHWWIPLVLIDHRWQRHGVGQAAMQAIIEDVRSRSPRAVALGLSYHSSNAVAARLYASLGFEVEAEPDAKGEVAARLPLRR